MSKFIFLIFFCAVVLILSANNAFACTCIESSFEDSQKQNSKIFSGKVIRVQTGKLFRKARIRVENVWKGSLPKTITVTTMANGSLCAYKFLFGKSYLIVPYWFNSPWLCHGNKIIRILPIQFLAALPREKFNLYQ